MRLVGATSQESVKTPLPFVEFVALMALMIALVAISIDAMLPALPDIGRELGASRPNDNQLVLSALFLGMAIGQIVYGPLSDSVGRKPAIYAGLAIYATGCVVALLASTFPVMLGGRFLQGIGLAGPRSLAVAVVRDQYSGRLMARVMSFVMAIFILVPIVAPSLGQFVILFAHWRAIFIVYLCLAILVLAWFGVRQPETLTEERRIPFTLTRIRGAFAEVLGSRAALGYTVTAGLVSGAFLGYLNSAQQVFQDQYGVGTRFPLYFAALAVGSGLGSFMNGRLVLRFGMHSLSHGAALIIAGLSCLFFVGSLRLDGNPPLWTLVGYLLVVFFAVGILFGNLNALAMVPLGHIAGVGAAVVGSVSTLMSTPIGAFIGRSFDGTIMPLVGGFALLNAVGVVIMRWAETGSGAMDREHSEPAEAPD